MLLALAVTLAGIGLLPSLSAQGAAKTTRRPNVVLIMADDMGYTDIGCYGSEVRTPTLDRLAEDGVRMTQFYNCLLYTSPSPRDLSTSRMPSSA